MTNDEATRTILSDLVAANRILYAKSVLDAFGHVSVRHHANPERFWLSRNLAPGLVTADDIMEFDLDGNPVDARGRAVYLERFLHGEIYRHRPDVQAVVHSHSPAVVPFGVSPVALRPIYHMSGFLGSGAPVFDIRKFAGATDMLIRNSSLGAALAGSLGSASAVLMRGHGSVAVGGSLPQAVFRAVYLEVNARLQSEAIKLGEVNFLTPEEARMAAAANDTQILRPWTLWKREALQGD